jgi:hypothetical protein
MHVPKGLIDDRPKMTPDEESVILVQMRERFSGAATRSSARLVPVTVPSPAPDPTGEGTDPQPWPKK